MQVLRDNVHKIFHKVDNLFLYALENKLKYISYLHLSIDDVHDCFEKLHKDKISIWQEDFFNILRDLHVKYGAKFTLFCLEDSSASIPKENIGELAACADWLSLAWHGSYRAGNKVKSFINFMERYKNTGIYLGSVLRLHNFEADKELVGILKQYGISGLLCADDKRNSYGRTYKEYSSGKDSFYRQTDMRLENFISSRLLLTNRNTLYIFAHEMPFMKYKEYEKLDTFLQLTRESKFII